MKSSETIFTIYLGEDKDFFKQLKKEVKTLWYTKFGESLKNKEIVIISLKVLRDSLNGKEFVKENYKSNIGE
jgi:hypothetical protein